MKFENRKSNFYSVFAGFRDRVSIFTMFYNDLFMPFCPKAAQKLLRRPSEAVEVWVSSGRLWRSSGRLRESSGRLHIEKLPISRPSGRYAICFLYLLYFVVGYVFFVFFWGVDTPEKYKTKCQTPNTEKTTNIIFYQQLCFLCI